MITLNVTGMDCQGCVRAVEKAVKRVDPQAQVIVDLPTGQVSIDTAHGDRAGFESAITKAGYGLKDVA